MRVLVTGFEAFPGVSTNPTERLVGALPRRVGDVEVTAAVLPVDSGRIAEALSALEPTRFDARLHLGVAQDRDRVSLERVAVNRLAFARPDNRGASPSGPIDPEGPETRASRLPLSALGRAFGEAGLEVELSEDAGTYLCNQLMYLSIALDERPAGFVHVPPDEALAAQLPPGARPAPFARLADGLLRALRALGAEARG